MVHVTVVPEIENEIQPNRAMPEPLAATVTVIEVFPVPVVGVLLIHESETEEVHAAFDDTVIVNEPPAFMNDLVVGVIDM